MSTERASPRYCDIDLWDSPEILNALIESQMAAVAAVRPVLANVAAAAEAMEARLRSGGGRIIYVGAGTSGRLAVQDGAELIPTFNWPQERLLLLIAGGHDALVRAVEGAEDQIERAVKLAREHRIGTTDVVIAVSASGTTPFTLACMRDGKKYGALAIGIASNADTPILEEADCPIWLDTGPEPIAGSTRMKAGTAQRVVLNLLSSLVMIRLGHVHQGLMVDVQATNAKLVRRSRSILHRLTGRSATEIADALEEARGNVKVAVLLLNGCKMEQALQILEQCDGKLRTALRLIGCESDGAADELKIAEELPSVPVP
jgi:N-acetylmuramic acid 6-phosphate etherase